MLPASDREQMAALAAAARLLALRARWEQLRAEQRAAIRNAAVDAAATRKSGRS
jgi:hypothetical protein